MNYGKTHRRALVSVATVLALASLLLAACQPDASTPAPTPITAQPTNTPLMEATPMKEPTRNLSAPSAEERLVALIGDNLAQRLHTDTPAIAVRSVERVTWPDASLGCPQPGHMYAQVLTPGYRAEVEVEGKIYTYHASEGGQLILCVGESAADTAPAPTMTRAPVEPGLESITDAAMDDLSQHLGLPREQIAVAEARAVVWPDASLGCPQPEMRYKQVPVDGALVLLLANGETYAYHSGGGQAPFLCQPSVAAHKDTPPAIDLLPQLSTRPDKD